ncbi:DUF1707 domain-containing protein [Corynebacterium sp. NPDC060344]|uniref:DUF1707 SHOCT-like domain-containing protein n=1 Tax=Corynebacterium sp. NPDC060344 TaxID=3347101 RepID=UPI0036543707
MNASDDPRPLRATDDERGRVADELSNALARGQIDLTEFDERTHRAWSARTRDELADPLADLVPDPWAVIGGSANSSLPANPAPNGVVPHDAPSSRDLAAVSKAHVTGEPGGSRLSVAIMFGAGQDGDWICPPTHHSIALMGGVELDLRRARFEAPETEIVAIAVMGGIQIIVPEDIRLTVQGTGLMGGFGSSDSRDVVISGHDLPPDAPRVRVTGLALMGGVDVHRVPRGDRRELR